MPVGVREEDAAVMEDVDEDARLVVRCIPPWPYGL